MSQPGRLAVPVACLPAWREDTLMTVVAMSHGELSRYDTLRRFERGELRIEDVAILLGICRRPEDHTSELQSLMRTCDSVFCLKKKTHRRHTDRADTKNRQST